VNPAEDASRPIRLLHVFSTFAVGGPQIRFATIADRLGPKYRHLIVSMSGKTDAVSLLSSQIDNQLIPVWSKRAKPRAKDSVGGPRPIRNTPKNPIANIIRFSSELARLKPDLLITYNWGALEWAIGNRFGPRFPHVHVEDGFGPDEASERFRRRVWLRRLGMGRETKAIVVPSHSLERIARDEWKLKRRVVYLPNGVDTARFGAKIPQAEWAFVKKPGEIVVGTCAALRPEKNLERLIRAFAASGAVNSRLVICGDGPERATLVTAAAANGLADRVLFTGHLARPELALAGFDIFAMSSNTEQMPYGLLEAMAMALPAAATDVGDIRSTVAEANRPYIVPLADEAALTGALRNLYKDAALRARLGAANQAKARSDFSIETMVAAYDRLFESAARAGG
jgi:glycosyltransferase involved in cell wall biosynthesis